MTAPGGEKWEVYTVLADSQTFGTSPDLLAADPAGGCSCSACDSAEEVPGEKAAATSACC